MRSWQLAVLCVACLAAVGCRVDPAVVLLERENRELEYRLFELADVVEEHRRENETLRKRLERLQPGAGGPGDSIPSPEVSGPALGPPGEASAPTDLTEGLKSLAVEVPEADISGEEFLKRHSREETPAPPFTLPEAPTEEAPTWPEPSEPADDEGPRWPGPSLPHGAKRRGGAATEEVVPCRADNTQVASVTLDERFTAGYGLDERAGHDGIVTVVQPRDSAGQPLAAAAPVSVVVLDPLLQGEAARIARWNLSAQEVARRYRKTPLSEGIHLELAWPGAVPIHDRLHLFVRYTTDDGRKLEADREIAIEVPAFEARRLLPDTASGGPACGWQRRSSPERQLPESEPARTALAPATPERRPAESPTSRPRSSATRQSRPVWSPDRL